jgi:ribose transport system substrate-binding protein
MRRLTVAALGAALALTACGGGGGGGGGGARSLDIAVVPKAIGFDFWEDVHKGAQCQASKLSNVKVEWNGVTAETDVSGQVSLLQSYLTRHVDGLVYAATDAKALYQVTQQAQQDKIPVFNIDSGTSPQPSSVPLYATDNQASAVKAADLMAQALHDQGKVAMIEFQPGSMTNDQRVSGFKQGLQKHPGIQLVTTQSSNSDSTQALAVTENILTAHPDLNGIFAANEPSVIGAAQAVARRGLSGKVQIIGWDAAPDEVKAVQSGEISALVVQNPFRMGYDSVTAIVKLIRSKVQPHSQDTGVTFVNKDNLNDSKIKSVLTPSCSSPPV